MDTLGTQRLAKMFLQHLVHRTQNVINDLNRSIYDAQFLSRVGEGPTEKLVVRAFCKTLQG